MASGNAPSEFGGRVQRNGQQPSPHIPTASERLRNVYRSGAESGINPFTQRPEPDNGEAWVGLLPLAEQRKIRLAAGDLEKGQVWEEMQKKGEQELKDIDAT